MVTSAFVAFGICLAGAGLEGLAAGTGVSRRLSELRRPRFSPPLGLWVGIAVLYYVVCFIVAYRLMEAPPGFLRTTAIALLLALMALNAAWNYVFFRRKALGASARVFLPYGALALVLLGLLVTLDAVAASAFLAYVLYLPYGTWWFFALQRANAEK